MVGCFCQPNTFILTLAYHSPSKSSGLISQAMIMQYGNFHAKNGNGLDEQLDLTVGWAWSARLSLNTVGLSSCFQTCTDFLGHFHEISWRGCLWEHKCLSQLLKVFSGTSLASPLVKCLKHFWVGLCENRASQFLENWSTGKKNPQTRTNFCLLSAMGMDSRHSLHYAVDRFSAVMDMWHPGELANLARQWGEREHLSFWCTCDIEHTGNGKRVHRFFNSFLPAFKNPAYTC